MKGTTGWTNWGALVITKVRRIRGLENRFYVGLAEHFTAWRNKGCVEAYYLVVVGSCACII